MLPRHPLVCPKRFASSRSASLSNRTLVVAVGIAIASFERSIVSSEQPIFPGCCRAIHLRRISLTCSRVPPVQPISSTCSVFGDRRRCCGGAGQSLGGRRWWEGARCSARLVVVVDGFVHEAGRPSLLGTIDVAPANRRRRPAREK